MIENIGIKDKGERCKIMEHMFIIKSGLFRNVGFQMKSGTESDFTFN